ncbi:nitroreductase family protein [Aquibacillus sediminis]|uniref:nitroreductase family protein n=1 Tax=Aquibacillus sediminis TaxID=2574734 RepID=UPI001486235B|nr:nitroreductase [Aquibacillus sediminis]
MTIDVLEAIHTRRSILQFKSDPIDRQVLTELFDHAAWAPNHHRKEPWNLNIYEDNARLTLSEKVVDAYLRHQLITPKTTSQLEKMRRKYDSFFTTAPYHALIYMEKEDDGGYLDDENFAAVCAFIQNFQLAAWSKGIGTLWTAKAILRDEQFIRDLHLDPTKHKLVSVLHIGYPSNVPNAKPRTPLSEKIQWVKN